MFTPTCKEAKQEAGPKVMVNKIGTVIATWHVKGFKVMLWKFGTEIARRKIYPRVDQNLPMSRKGFFWHGSCKGPKVLTRFYLSLGATLKETCYKAVFGSLITLDKIIKNPHPYISAWNGGKAPIGSELFYLSWGHTLKECT